MAVGNSGMISSTMDFFLKGVDNFLPLAVEGGGVIIRTDVAIESSDEDADDERDDGGNAPAPLRLRG